MILYKIRVAHPLYPMVWCVDRSLSGQQELFVATHPTFTKHQGGTIPGFGINSYLG
ncbi:hypothetical protein [Microcoleus sp. B9-D4]|uniref:hypothetical protein n=1 Tax=Microcoleus sp. B9-D4 TaxID=2818711 RepID=UPI002FCF4D58